MTAVMIYDSPAEIFNTLLERSMFINVVSFQTQKLDEDWKEGLEPLYTLRAEEFTGNLAELAPRMLVERNQHGDPEQDDLVLFEKMVEALELGQDFYFDEGARSIKMTRT